MKNPANWLTPATKYFSSSISSKIITPYFVLTLLFTAFGIFVVTQLVVVGLEERLKNQLVGASSVVREEIVNREELRLEVERVVANTEQVPETIVARDFDLLKDLISPQITNNQDIDSIILVDTQGNELLRLQRESDAANAFIEEALGSNVSYQSWPAVQTVLANPEGAKEVQLGRNAQTGDLITYTVGPVRTEDGVVGAVLVGTYLRKEMRALSSLALADITLFDRNTKVIDSTLVFDDPQAADAVFAVFTPAKFQEVLDNPNITLLDEISVGENKSYRIAYAPFILRDDVRGAYGVALPTSFITEQDNSSRNLLIVIFSLGIAAVFGVGYLISNRIVQPILQLVQTSHAIAQGDLSQRTGLRRDDEIGILANTFDNMTSELQKKTHELEEEASKLTAILRSIADGVMVQDLEGKIIRMNPAAAQILEAIVGDISPIHYQESGTEIKGVLGKEQIPLLKKLTGLQFHEVQRFEVDRRVLSAISAPVVTSDGEQLGAVVVLRDITREVEAEKLKDDFITSMSHELRTPLTAIKGYNDLLKLTISELNERQVGFVDNIEKNVGALLNLIQAILDISQIEAGNLGTDQEQLDFTELLAMESEKWGEKMAEKELLFEAHFEPGPVWVEGDWSRLTRVLHNLLDNAYNYTPPGGRVNLRLKAENGRAEVEVFDTGVGIAKEDQRFIFTRFFRAIHADHNEAIHEVSGAGLGLYISKAIVEAHGGQIWFESKLNHGTHFAFTIPLIKSPNSVEKKTIEYLTPHPVEESQR